jgi:hypothetical protein
VSNIKAFEDFSKLLLKKMTEAVDTHTSDIQFSFRRDRSTRAVRYYIWLVHDISMSLAYIVCWVEEK